MPQPETWNPPEAHRRSQIWPFALAGAGVLLVAAIVAGVVLVTDGEQTAGTGPTAVPASPQETQEPQAAVPTDPETAPDAAREQATAIDTLLDAMSETRSRIGAAISPECDADALTAIRDERRDQLRQAESLQVDALGSGSELKDALTRALRASIESNELYIQYAPDCPGSAANDVNDRATAAKREFLGYWNPIAAEYGLPSRDVLTI